MKLNHGRYIREPAEGSDFSQPLWNNILIKIENKPVIYRSWYIINVRHVNELLEGFGLFISPAELIAEYV